MEVQLPAGRNNCIKVCYKEVDIEASSLRLQHRYDTIQNYFSLFLICEKILTEDGIVVINHFLQKLINLFPLVTVQKSPNLITSSLLQPVTSGVVSKR